MNVSQHMVKIKQELETAEQSGDDDSVARKEELLEELLEIVESIDHAKGKCMDRLNHSNSSELQRKSSIDRSFPIFNDGMHAKALTLMHALAY